MSSTFQTEFLNLMESCYHQIEKYPNQNKPSYLNLSTMTMICELTAPIDILLFSENFKSPKNIHCTIKRPQHNTEFVVTKRGKKKKTFFNQASIHFRNHTTKCIKVFSNGRLHITGVTSMSEAVEVSSFVCSILNNTIGAVIGNKKVEAKDLQICMINTNFSLNHGINILKLKKVIINENVICNYTPDTYPGLKIKYTQENNNKTSVFIFSSGQIVITGAKQMDEIQSVYNYLMDTIINNYDNIYNSKIPTKEQKQKKDVVCYKNGYDNTLI